MAGVAAALTNNDSLGVAGVAGGWGPDNPGCSLVGFRCSETDSNLSTTAVIDAIESAYTDWHCAVLNASFGSDTYNEALREAVFNAHTMGLVFVAAKGYVEDNGNLRSFPADFDHDWVVCVSASNQYTGDPVPERRVSTKDIPYEYTARYGYGLDVLAPGIDIYSTKVLLWDNTYGYFYPSGTSFAAPQVAGLAGLILSQDSTLCPDDVEGLICAGCDDILTDPDGGDSLVGYDQWSGWGRIDAERSLRFLNCPWSLDWCTVDGYTSAQMDSYHKPFFMIGQGAPVPPEGFYWEADRWDLRRDITYPLGCCIFGVWGRGVGASTGWSGANWNYMAGFCRVVDGSRTETGCQLQTFVYALYYYDAFFNTWIPYAVYPPGPIRFAYTLLGIPGQGSVQSNGGDPEAGLLALKVTPNPASAPATFALSLPEPGPVSLSLYAVDGSLVRCFVHGALDRGRHEIVWDGKDRNGKSVAPGVYLYRLEWRGSHASGKVVWVK